MKLHRTILTLALCAALTLGLTPTADAAASVRVKLPTFAVTLCGQTIDPAKEEYPFLVYKDITYLPLTYFGCRLMGLYAKWSWETGLVISDAGAKGAYQSTPRVSRNSGALYAQKATGAIAICHKAIENDKEEYPFLLFRDVTYLPMTWANMHDLLGCDYRWDAKNGLVIDRAGDENASALYLPLDRDEDGTIVGSIAAWRGWFWYQDDEGFVSRTSMSGGAREKLFELPINVGYSELPAWASLKVENDALYLSYHLGGATMGHDELYRFNEDGTYVALNASSGPVGEFGDLWLRAESSLMPRPDNLQVSRDKGATWERFGDANYIYGWAYHQDTTGGAQASRTMGEILGGDGRYAYLLATDATGWGAAEPDADGAYRELYSKVSRVDLTTGETTQLGARPANRFIMAGGMLWYTDFERKLWSCRLDGRENSSVWYDADASLERFDFEQATVQMFSSNGGRGYAALTVPFHVQGGAGVEPHDEATTCLAMLSAGSGKIVLANIGTVQSMTAEDGWLTLLLKNDSGEMGLMVLHDGVLVYRNSGPDYLAAGVSGGKLYYVLR